jgi:anti-sigma factor RsiW
VQDRSDNETILIQYLLGELSEEEQSSIEQKYFLDQDYRRELSAIERDLIDRYVRGELSEERHERFERYFMRSPGRKERIEFASALAMSGPATLVSKPESTPVIVSRWSRFLGLLSSNPRAVAAATVMLVATLFGIWLITYFRDKAAREAADQVLRQQKQKSPPQIEERPKQEPAPPNGERDQHIQAGGRAPERVLPHPSTSTRTAVFVLGSGLVRNDDAVKEFLVPRSRDRISLQAYLDGDGYDRYRAALQTPEGEQVFNWNELKVKPGRSQQIVVSLSAKLLTSRDYVLRIDGITIDGRSEEVGKYYFRVIRQ